MTTESERIYYCGTMVPEHEVMSQLFLIEMFRRSNPAITNDELFDLLNMESVDQLLRIRLGFDYTH